MLILFVPKTLHLEDTCTVTARLTPHHQQISMRRFSQDGSSQVHHLLAPCGRPAEAE